MNDRRSFLSLLAAASATAAPPLSGAPPRVRTAGVIPLPAPFTNQTATLVEVTYGPGDESAAHKHPGFVLGYVIEGEFRFQVDGQPVRVLKAGETFYEQPGSKHLVSAAGPDKGARILAIIIAEPGHQISERL
jgi:quercetin dioxygenase-like cupin family protein